MAEADYEQRMRELQRQYVDFLDDSDRDGVYDRSVVLYLHSDRLLKSQFSYGKTLFIKLTNVMSCT